ncbi:MAG: hypothetical protein GY854_04925 [Deltaproteobacteria bacterium]|nr:hypothetical protein [Deltaproteobacteria bacterium]
MIGNHRTLFWGKHVFFMLLTINLIGCPDVVIVNGKVTVTGLPDTVESIVVTLETTRAAITIELDAKNGRAGPIELGPEFVGTTYNPGKIKVTTYEGTGTEKRYKNKITVEVKRSREPQEIDLSDFEEL